MRGNAGRRLLNAALGGRARRLGRWLPKEAVRPAVKEPVCVDQMRVIAFPDPAIGVSRWPPRLPASKGKLLGRPRSRPHPLHPRDTMSDGGYDEKLSHQKGDVTRADVFDSESHIDNSDVPPEARLKRQLKNRHVAMIR